MPEDRGLINLGGGWGGFYFWKAGAAAVIPAEAAQCDIIVG
jgi:hypothetical protein